MIFKNFCKKLSRTVVAFLVSICLIQPTFDSSFFTASNTPTIYAHSGRTDSSGGHKDNKNASGLGYYHYHCGGNPPHLHSNGICPYSTGTKSNTTSKAETLSKSNIKLAQKKLNKLGYECGTPDGIIGTKTKKAIKAFQKNKGISINGTLDKNTLNKLGL